LQSGEDRRRCSRDIFGHGRLPNSS
jgi:hypothetical protein